ncbi:MAG: hypothetical protein Q4G06_07285, partial [Clostridia bacterium]|nr:hypothetical protein [Clostridia bacterium]
YYTTLSTFIKLFYGEIVLQGPGHAISEKTAAFRAPVSNSISRARGYFIKDNDSVNYAHPISWLRPCSTCL